MTELLRKSSGANMDIDLTTPQNQIEWEQAQCPWNFADVTEQHKCAVKKISICPTFRGMKVLDTVLCSYPYDSA